MPENKDFKIGLRDMAGTETSLSITGGAVTVFTRALLITFAVATYQTQSIAAPASAGGASSIPSGGVSRPGDFLPELPEPGAPAEAPIEAPQEKEPVTDKEKVPYGIKVFVNEVRLKGNTVFTGDELQQIIAPYTNRVVSSSELEDLRVALTRHYIDHGYLNSGAVIPDQKIVDGIVTMVIIEGRLTDIEIVGNTHLNDSYIIDRLALGAGPPLNVNDLQQQIQIILESPTVDTINSALRPGDRPGEASLVSEVKEGPRFQFIPVIDNRLSPSLGDVRAVLPVYAYDLTGYGDVFSAGVGLAEGLTDSFANWSIPLNAHDTTFSLYYDRSDGEIVNGSFEPLNITSETTTVGFTVSHPFYRKPGHQFSMALGLDLRSSESKLDGEGYPFVEGVEDDGTVDATIIRFSQNWSKREPKQVLAARSMFSFGIDAFDATINEGDVPSGEFVAWLGQFQWANLYGKDLGQLIFRANVQYTNDPLFSMEQFAVGGALSVRGYRENQIVRDTGYDVSLEYRYPLMTDADGRSVLAVAPFVDAGGGNNNVLPNGPNPEYIYSAGLGLRWDPTTRVHAEVYWGHAYKDVITDDGYSLQDDGIHFLLSANLLEYF